MLVLLLTMLEGMVSGLWLHSMVVWVEHLPRTPDFEHQYKRRWSKARWLAQDVFAGIIPRKGKSVITFSISNGEAQNTPTSLPNRLMPLSNKAPPTSEPWPFVQEPWQQPGYQRRRVNQEISDNNNRHQSCQVPHRCWSNIKLLFTQRCKVPWSRKSLCLEVVCTWVASAIKHSTEWGGGDWSCLIQVSEAKSIH